VVELVDMMLGVSSEESRRRRRPEIRIPSGMEK